MSKRTGLSGGVSIEPFGGGAPAVHVCPPVERDAPPENVSLGRDLLGAVARGDDARPLERIGESQADR